MYIPTKNELKIATIDVLKEKNSECTTEYINDQVAKHLNLSEEYLLSEDENGLGTAYNYRMRWIRTELKKEGKIINIKRGIWRIAFGCTDTVIPVGNSGKMVVFEALREVL